MDDFRVRFSQDAILVVPGGSFKEETVQVAAILRGLCLGHGLIAMLEHFVREVNLIDRIMVFSGIVLFDSGQERLCEKEA